MTDIDFDRDLVLSYHSNTNTTKSKCKELELMKNKRFACTRFIITNTNMCVLKYHKHNIIHFSRYQLTLNCEYNYSDIIIHDNRQQLSLKMCHWLPWCYFVYSSKSINIVNFILYIMYSGSYPKYKIQLCLYIGERIRDKHQFLNISLFV